MLILCSAYHQDEGDRNIDGRIDDIGAMKLKLGFVKKACAGST